MPRVSFSAPTPVDLSTRIAMAQHIAAKTGLDAEVYLPMQWYAEDLRICEQGIATKVFAPDHAYWCWVFQSEENPEPGLVPSTRIVLSGHCDIMAALQAERWAEKALEV